MEYKDINNPDDLFLFMKQNIKYGFVSKNNKNIYTRKKVNNDFLYNELIFREYYLQSPEELLKSKYGLCYDQVELVKKWLTNHDYPTTTYYADYMNHAFNIYYDFDESTYNLFERTLPYCNKIYKAKTFEEILNIYKKMQFTNASSILNEINLYEYKNIIFGIDFYEYVTTAKKSKKIITLKR